MIHRLNEWNGFDENWGVLSQACVLFLSDWAFYFRYYFDEITQNANKYLSHYFGIILTLKWKFDTNRKLWGFLTY